MPLVERLKSDHHLVLGSNTDPIHFSYAVEKFHVVQNFEQYFLSYEMGLLKPDPAFFHHILQTLGTPAAECIFIDDRAENVDAALSVGISLQTVWVLVWFIAGIIALVTGIAWGARAGVSFALEVIAYKALPVLMLGGLESITGAIIGGLMIGILEKLFEIYWGQPLLGGNTETWFAFVLALVVLLFRPQGLFGERIIERV